MDYKTLLIVHRSFDASKFEKKKNVTASSAKESDCQL